MRKEGRKEGALLGGGSSCRGAEQNRVTHHRPSGFSFRQVRRGFAVPLFPEVSLALVDGLGSRRDEVFHLKSSRWSLEIDESSSSSSELTFTSSLQVHAEEEAL